MQEVATTNTKLSVPSKVQKVAGFIFLDIAFVSVVALVSYRSSVSVTALDLLLLSLATFRLARSVSFNEIFEWLREPFTEVVPDSSGAGDSVVPKGKGFSRVIGGLLACPICSGTWSALVLFTVFALVPTFGTYLVYVLAFAGGSEILHWWSEKNEWQGRAAREDAGTQWLRKNK